jgi:hypothetical protein
MGKGSGPVVMSRRQARLAAQGLAGVRALIGVVAWAAPHLALDPWVGPDLAAGAEGRLLGRALGARDLALGAGALLAIRHGGPVRGWIEAGGLADTGDAGATLLAFGRLPRRSRWLVLASIVGAVAAAYVIAPSVDVEEE